MKPAAQLARLRRLHAEYGGTLAAQKVELVTALSRARLATSAQVLALHEALLFLRAYPDDARVLAACERALQRFSRRADLQRHKEALADTGIAGTSIHYAFFPATASWLAREHGRELTIDWDSFENEELLMRNLWLFTLNAEASAFDGPERAAREWIAKLKGPDETDAEFLVRRIEGLHMAGFERARFAEELDLPFTLAPGPKTPSRTLARADVESIHYQTGPLRRERPDLVRELRQPPLSVRTPSPRAGAKLVQLARETMVTHNRDLDAFMYADARDVRVFDCGDGLAFACLGVVPEQRLMLEAVYGFLTLKNGVPIGYVLASAGFHSSEVAYNVFSAFRGAEAAHVYARALAVVRTLFESDTFTVYPYQLGHENEEGLKSGAWWFYQKLGFRPRDASVLRLMRRELARMRSRPKHRSNRATLEKLAAHNVYLSLGKIRDDVIGVYPLAKIGAAVSSYVARRFGADRERASRTCAEEAAAILGARTWRRFPVSERIAFERWSPLVRCLAGVEHWNAREKRALVAVMRAKGGRRESEFVRLLDGHTRLRSALRALVRGRRVP